MSLQNSGTLSRSMMSYLVGGAIEEFIELGDVEQTHNVIPGGRSY